MARAGLVNLAGGAVGSVVGLVLAALVGHHLGTEGAGSYFLALAAFLIVSNIAELGADTGLVRFVSAARATGREPDVPQLVRTAVRPVLVGGLIVVVGAVFVLRLWPAALGDLPRLLVLAGTAAAAMASLTALMLAVTRGFGDALTYPLLQNIMLPVLRLAGVATCVWAGSGVVAVIAWWLAPTPLVLGLATVIALRAVRSGSPGRPEPASRRLSREFWSFSATRGVAAAVEIGLEWADVLIVGALTSPAEAGVYAVVTRCARVGEVIQQAARVTVGPQLSAALARGALREAGEIYGVVTAAMIWLAWPFFLVLAIFGDAVLSVFGPGFDAGAGSLAVLSLAMAVSLAAGTVQTILLMGGRSRWQLADKSVALVLNLCLDVVLIPVWGIEGAAVAWAVTIIVDTAIVVWQVQRLMGVRPYGHQLRNAAGLSLAMVGSLAGGSRLLFGPSLPVLMVTLAVVGALYVAVSWPLRHHLGLPRLLDLRT